MKKLRVSLLCLLMCLLLILSFAGCRHEPVDPTGGSSPTTTTAPTNRTEPTSGTEPTQPTAPSQPTVPSKPTDPVPEPHPAEAYIKAAEELEMFNAIHSAISIDTTMIVGGETHKLHTDMKILRSHRDTQSPRFRVYHSADLNLSGSSSVLEEYIDGTLYVSFADGLFYGAADPKEYAAQVLPIVPIDPSLYSTITQTSEGGTNSITFTFANSSAAESWALPEDAEFLDAYGTVLIDLAGKLDETRYTINYRYCGVQITKSYRFRSAKSSNSVSPSEDIANYRQVQNPTALRLLGRALMTINAAHSANSAIISSASSIFTQAAGAVLNQNVTLSWHKGNAVLLNTDIYQMNYATNEEQTYTLEERYRDKTYTVIENGGTPVTHSNVIVDIGSYYSNLRQAALPRFPHYFAEADFVCTDLGSTVFVQIVYGELFAEEIRKEICTSLWGDADYLNNLSSKYVTNEITGYFAIDKYTGFPTAVGYYYSGTHTIQGTDCLLTAQMNQAIEFPGMDAYYNIYEKHPSEIEPLKKPTPLFYHVTGKDGQEMWLFGTIHIGDHRTAYLPKEIKDAFTASDALALEYNSKAFDAQVEADEQLKAQVSDAYFLSDGKTLKDTLGDELYAEALKYLMASGNYNINANYMKPFLWESSIRNFFLRQGYSLRGSKGVESRLHTWAEEQKKPILEVESGLFQVQMMANFSEELQAYMLASILSEDALESNNETMELYEKWCAGDEAALRKELSTQVDMADMSDEEKAEYEKYKHLLDEYNKAMDTDRNAAMLQVAKSYLESDKVVFFAVGLAHLLSDDGGLVDALRAAGYTVEQVKYN